MPVLKLTDGAPVGADVICDHRDECGGARWCYHSRPHHPEAVLRCDGAPCPNLRDERGHKVRVKCVEVKE